MAMVRNDILIKFKASQEDYDSFKQWYIALDKEDTVEQLEFLYGDEITQEQLNDSVENFAKDAKEFFEKEIKFSNGYIVFKKENLTDFNYPLVTRALINAEIKSDKEIFIGIVSTNRFKGDYFDIFMTEQGARVRPSEIKKSEEMYVLLMSKEYHTLNEEVKQLLKIAKQRLNMR